jgi:DNA polymerase III subunit epsilon
MLSRIKRTLHWRNLKDRSYEFLFENRGTDEVVAVDCETTGLNPKHDDIVSIAAVKIRRNQILTSEAYRVNVKPKANLAADAIKIHQIRRADVAGERRIEDELPAFLRFIGNLPLVGYWISFDVKMLNKSVVPLLGIPLQNPLIDVSDLYYDRKYGKAPPGTGIDLRFAAILADLNLPPLKAHDPFDDAVSTAELYLVLQDMKARGVYLKPAPDWEQPMMPMG